MAETPLQGPPRRVVQEDRVTSAGELQPVELVRGFPAPRAVGHPRQLWEGGCASREQGASGGGRAGWVVERPPFKPEGPHQQAVIERLLCLSCEPHTQ